MPKQPKGVLIEYANPDDSTNPSYVEGAQGLVTRGKMLHVSFFSEFRKTKSTLLCDATKTENPNILAVKTEDMDPHSPNEDGNLVVIRRIEASILVDAASLENIVAWLQEKLQDMKS